MPVPEVLNNVLASALFLQGADFQPYGESHRFTNKQAIAIGELSLKPVLEAFEAQYPEGLFHEVIINFTHDALTNPFDSFGLSDDDEEHWKGPIADALNNAAQTAGSLLSPLGESFTAVQAFLSVTDEILAPKRNDENKIPHIDTSVATDYSLSMLKAEPRNTAFLKPYRFTAPTLKAIFPAGNLLAHLAAQLPDDAWVTNEEQAHLMSPNGSVHKRLQRPTDAAYRFRGLLRVNMRPYSDVELLERAATQAQLLSA